MKQTLTNSYTYSKVYTLWDGEKEDLYIVNKEYFDKNHFTKNDAAKYLAGNHYIWLDTQYAAIADGTCDY